MTNNKIRTVVSCSIVRVEKGHMFLPSPYNESITVQFNYK